MSSKDSWTLPYAILMTLLFALFVVLYSSQKTAKKDDPVSEKTKNEQIEEKESPEVPFPKMESRLEETQKTEKHLETLRTEIEGILQLEVSTRQLGETVNVLNTSRGVVIRLALRGLFEADQFEVPEDLRPLMDQIGRTLIKRTTNPIQIEGHADVSENHPWDLSFKRALWVAQRWFRRWGLDEKRVGITAFSSYRPLSVGKSLADRDLNRRIEIVVLHEK